MAVEYDFAIASFLGTPVGPARESPPGARFSAFSPVLLAERKLDRGFCFVLVEGINSGITSQIGSKIAVDAMVQRLTTPLSETDRALLKPHETPAPLMVQSAFKEANQQLFRYGQKMLSSGRISATGAVFVFDGDRVSVGKTGVYETFLYRSGELLRFFEPQQIGDRPALERFLGANKQILVDMATVRLQPGDRILVTSFPFDQKLEGECARVLAEYPIEIIPEQVRNYTAAKSESERSELSQKNLVVLAIEISPQAQF